MSQDSKCLNKTIDERFLAQNNLIKELVNLSHISEEYYAAERERSEVKKRERMGDLPWSP